MDLDFGAFCQNGLKPSHEGKAVHPESCPRPEKKFLYSRREFDIGVGASETTFTSNNSTEAYFALIL